MALRAMLRDIVIRPSGVWNSRAPFHDFLKAHRTVSRTYNVLCTCIFFAQYQLGISPNAGRAPKKVLKLNRLPMQASECWRSYMLSFPFDLTGSRHVPTCLETSKDLADAMYQLRESAIISYVSEFETFVLCWALNYLLTCLEGGREWTRAERSLARRLSPEHNPGSLPGWPDVAEAIPAMKDGLQNLPHIFSDPETGREVSEAVSPSLNAYTTMRFWRQFRNKLVHSGNVASAGFVRAHGEFFEELRAPYANYMGPLESNQRFKLYDSMFRAVSTTHYRSALWLTQWLEGMSLGRRGHPLAPGPRHAEGTILDPRLCSQPLLVDGDHADSLDWINDSAFRTEYRSQSMR